MSRIGRMPIAIPAGVTVSVAENNKVTVKGPKGELTRVLPTEMEIKVEGAEVTVSRPNDLKKMKSLHGLTRTLINNMVVGVTEGFEKKLEVNGVGYKAAKAGKKLTLSLMRMVPIMCRATVGIVGNVDHNLINIGKAGRKRHMGIRPTVRGSVMNPNDHPHGGGEGRSHCHISYRRAWIPW